MATPAHTHIPGTYGRRPPKRAPAIRFSAIRRGAPATPPAAVDYLAPLDGGWLMLGNGPDDSVAPGFPGCGDCVPCWWANTRRVISTTIGGAPSYPPWSQVLAVYRTQNPDFDPAGDPSTTGPGSPADNGMDIQTLLEFLVAHPGFQDGTLVGFAAVDYTSAEEVRAAIDAGGVLCIGINVQEAQQTQFSDGEPWNWVPGSPVEGGHCTAVGGYGPPGTGALGGDERFITWAAETSFTDSFWANGTEELWFPIWSEQLGTKEFQAGVDLAVFAAEYLAITGRPFPGPVPPAPPSPPAPVPVPPPAPPSPPAPVPVPPPTPVPPPAPVVPPVPAPDAADVTLNSAAGSWPQRHHFGENEHIARALQAWRTAKGFSS